MVPWKMPTHTARIQNWYSTERKIAYMVMQKYAAMQMTMSHSGFILRVAMPKRMAAGKATTCVTSSARTRLTSFSPSESP